MDFSIFLQAETWVTLLTLMFLEIALGVDNLVFITITTDRLVPEHQHIGRKLGLLGALVSRIVFLSFASYLVHMTNPLFTLNLGFYEHGFSIRDLILSIGGAYLIYKGITEQRGMLRLDELRQAEGAAGAPKRHTIGLPQAIGTIMVMDIVFSIDSVITAVGLADQLLVMIIAVMAAVFLMMAFIDQISDFINNHAEMKILALAFITMIGVLLVTEGLGLTSGIEVMGMELEKLIVYAALVFAFILEIVQMRYNHNLARYRASIGDGTPSRADVSDDVADADKGSGDDGSPAGESGRRTL